MFRRVGSVMGDAIDANGAIQGALSLPIRQRAATINLNPDEMHRGGSEVLETGIKIIDLMYPMVKGSKAGIMGGAALGKSLLTLELIHNVVERHQGACIFTGVG